MTPYITPYMFQTHEIRTIELDGTFWFLGTDILKTLFGTDAGRNRTYNFLNETQRRVVPRETISLPPGKHMTIISTDGLDALLIRSRQQIAHEMRYWLRAVGFPRCAEQ